MAHHPQLHQPIRLHPKPNQQRFILPLGLVLISNRRPMLAAITKIAPGSTTRPPAPASEVVTMQNHFGELLRADIQLLLIIHLKAFELYRLIRSGHCVHVPANNALCMFLGSLLFVTVGCKTPITFPTHIAFPSDRDGVNQIYMMKSDGTELNRITQDVFNVEQPALSPLGLKVAFRSTKNGSSEIWSILTDGSGLTQLTHLQSVANGRWSPNGDLIAFSASPANFTAPDVYIMRNDGSRQTRLTDNPSNDAEIG